MNFIRKKSFLLLLFILLGLNSTWGNDDISPVARALKGRTVNAKGASASVNEKAGYYVFIFSSIGCGPSIDLISGNSSTAWQKALKKSKVPTECIVVFLPGEHDFDDRVVNRLKKLDNPLPYPYLLPSHLPCRFYPNYTNGTPAIHVFDGKGREVPFSSRDPQELMAKLEEFDALPEGERTYIKPDTVQKMDFSETALVNIWSEINKTPLYQYDSAGKKMIPSKIPGKKPYLLFCSLGDCSNATYELERTRLLERIRFMQEKYDRIQFLGYIPGFSDGDESKLAEYSERYKLTFPFFYSHIPQRLIPHEALRPGAMVHDEYGYGLERIKINGYSVSSHPDSRKQDGFSKVLDGIEFLNGLKHELYVKQIMIKHSVKPYLFNSIVSVTRNAARKYPSSIKNLPIVHPEETSSAGGPKMFNDMEKNKVQDSSIPDFKWTPDSKAEAVMADAVKYNLPVLIYFPDPWKKSPIKDIESAAFKRGMKGVALGLLVKTSKKSTKKPTPLEEKYGIGLYPTRILVSPDGKKIDSKIGAEFGNDIGPEDYVNYYKRLRQKE